MGLSNLWHPINNRRARRARAVETSDLPRPKLPWRRLPLRIEALEQRITPDGTPLEIALAAPVSAITLRLNGSELQAVRTEAPGEAPVAARALADISEVRIIGDPGQPEA